MTADNVVTPTVALNRKTTTVYVKFYVYKNEILRSNNFLSN